MNQPFVTTGGSENRCPVTELKLAGIANTPYKFKQGPRVRNSDIFLLLFLTPK